MASCRHRPHSPVYGDEKIVRSRALSVIVWAAFGIITAAYCFLLAYNHLGRPLDIGRLADEATLSIFLIVSAGIGALIVSHQPRNTIGWLLMFSPAAIAVVNTVIYVVIPALTVPGETSGLNLLGAWLEGWSWWLLMGPIFLIPLLFPTGKLISPAWRWVIVELAVCVLIFMFVVTFSEVLPDANNPDIGYPNPIGFLSEEVTSTILIPFEILLIGTAFSSVAAIAVRYVRAASLEREQIRWLLFAFGVLLATYFVNFIPGVPDSLWGALVFNFAITGIPIAIGFAILRFRLYDIDVIIRNTLIYGSLTLLLSAVYLVIAIGLQQLFVRVTGQQNPVALVIATLAIVLLFNRLRLRIQQFIDRRFFRSRYDAERLLNEFAQFARDEVDLEVLAEKLMSVTQDAVKPKRITFWIQETDQ